MRFLRLPSALPYFLGGLRIAGGLALTRFCAREVSRVPAIGWGRLAGSISTVLVAGVLLVASTFGPLPQAQEWIRQSFGHDGQALLTDDERALMTSVHELVPTDGVVVGDPFTGASLTPAFAQRTALAPEIPPVAESVPGYEWSGWYGLVAPARTSPAIIAKLNAGQNEAIKSAEFKERLAGVGAEPIGSTPQEYGAHIRAQLDKMKLAIKLAGVKAE